MKTLAAALLLTGLAFSGGASAAGTFNTGSGLNIPAEGGFQEVQYRRGRPRCFIETRRVRFIDRFGRPRVRVIQQRVCR